MYTQKYKYVCNIYIFDMCVEILHGHTCVYNIVVYDAYMFVSTYVWPQYRFICLQIHVYIHIYLYIFIHTHHLNTLEKCVLVLEMQYDSKKHI